MKKPEDCTYRCRMTQARPEEAYRMWMSGSNRKDIAKHFDVKPDTVRWWFKRDHWLDRCKAENDRKAASPVNNNLQIEVQSEMARLARAKSEGIERQIRLAKRSDAVWEKCMTVTERLLEKIEQLDFSDVGKLKDEKGKPILSGAQQAMVSLTTQLAHLNSKVLRPANQVFTALTGIDQERVVVQKPVGGLRIQNAIFTQNVRPLGIDDTVVEVKPEEPKQLPASA